MVQECDHTHKFIVRRHKADKKEEEVTHKLKESADTSQRQLTVWLWEFF